MKRGALLVLLLRAALVRSGRSVSCYPGDTVVLPSGADPSPSFSKIEWSVFPNTTWIATHRSGTTDTERVPRFAGRLALNASTGDLTIRDVTPQDGMEYTVLLRSSGVQDKVNKVELRVRKRLLAPDVQEVSSIAAGGGCLKTLRCSSPDAGVAFSWRRAPPDERVAGQTSFDGSAWLLTPVGHARPVEITCTTSANSETASSTITASCDDVTGRPTASPPPTMTPQRGPCPREQHGLLLLVGGLVGGGVAVVIFCFRGTLQSLWRRLKGKMCPSRDEGVL